MQFDQLRIAPFAPNQSRHDIVHRAENDHGEKRVKPEVRISDARLREVYVARYRSERNEHANHTKDGVRNRAEYGEAQCWTVAQQREVTLHRHVMIEANSGDGDYCKDGRSNAGRDHPGRKRSIDEPLHAGPARKKRVSPKADGRQMITVNRATDHFGDHVIGRAEPDRTEPEKKEIICVPPAHRRLQHSLHRHDEEHQLASRVEPWKPEKRAQQIPLRNVNLFAAPKAKHQHRPRNNEGVSDEKNDRGIVRKLQPLITGAVAEEDSAYA